jgi:hypothetical protein
MGYEVSIYSFVTATSALASHSSGFRRQAGMVIEGQKQTTKMFNPDMCRI